MSVNSVAIGGITTPSATDGGYSAFIFAESGRCGQIIFTGANSYLLHYLVQDAVPGSGPYLIFLAAGVWEIDNLVPPTPGDKLVYGLWDWTSRDLVANQVQVSASGWFWPFMPGTQPSEILTLNVMPLSAKKCSAGIRIALISS